MPVSVLSRRNWRVIVPVAVVLVALIVSSIFTIAARLHVLAATPSAVAPDGPGAVSYFDLARKASRV